MKLWTRMLLCGPLVFASAVFVIVAIVMSTVWLQYLRPIVESYQHRESSVRIQPSDQSTKSPVAKSELFNLLVLEWSHEIATLVEAYVKAQKFNANAAVIIFNRNGQRCTTGVAHIRAAIDSVWVVDSLQMNEPVSFASLSTVLRTGFNGAKDLTRTSERILVVGRFPKVPSRSELRVALKVSGAVLATNDYLWMQTRNGYRVIFVTTDKSDILGAKLRATLGSYRIQTELFLPRD